MPPVFGRGHREIINRSRLVECPWKRHTCVHSADSVVLRPLSFGHKHLAWTFGKWIWKVSGDRSPAKLLAHKFGAIWRVPLV